MAAARTALGATGAPATAGRFRRPAWREPRLLIGLGLVAASIAATTAAVAYGDSTDAYVVAARELQVGETIGEDDLRRVDLRLEATGESYVSGAQELGEGAVVVDRVAAGQLIPREAVGRAEDIDRRPLGIPLSTPMPAGTGSGDLVDVWVSQRERSGGQWSAPRQILAGAELAAIDESSGALGSQTEATAQVLVESDEVAPVVEALSRESRITLVPHIGAGR